MKKKLQKFVKVQKILSKITRNKGQKAKKKSTKIPKKLKRIVVNQVKN